MSSRKPIVSPSSRKKGKQNVSTKSDNKQNKKKEKPGHSTKTIDSFFRPVSSGNSLCRQNKTDLSNTSLDSSIVVDDDIVCPSPVSGSDKCKQPKTSERRNNPLKLKLKRKNIEKCISKDIVVVSDDSDKFSEEDIVTHSSRNNEENVSCVSEMIVDSSNDPGEKCPEERIEQTKEDTTGNSIKNDHLLNGIENIPDDMISIFSTYSSECTKSTNMKSKECPVTNSFDILTSLPCSSSSSSPVNQGICDKLEKHEISENNDNKDSKFYSLQSNVPGNKSLSTKLTLNQKSGKDTLADINSSDENSELKPNEQALKSQMKRKSIISEGNMENTVRKKQHVDDSQAPIVEVECIENGEMNDFNLDDDTFNEVDFDLLLSTKSDSITPSTNYVALDDSFVDINDDLNDVMITSEEDVSVLCTWKVTGVNVSNINISGKLINEKILSLKLQGDEIGATCSLRGDWYLMKINEGDIVYISALSESKRSCVLDNTSKHYLVAYPNTLISGTTIATGITCERQAVLNERFKVFGHTNKAMFLGTLTHDLFDWVLQNKGCSLGDIEKRARENLDNSKYLESLNMIGVDVEGIIDMQKEYYSSLQKWSTQFMGENCDTKIDLKIGDEREDCSTSLHVDNVIDIEENIWSPYYGFKGKIDATVEVTIHRKPALSSEISKRKYTLPLEFKTGKLFSSLGSIEHRAQVTVYTLLLSERYKRPIDFGLLLYGKVNHMVGVPRPEQEKRAILIKRNEIARNLSLERRELKLPDLIQNERLCKWCDQNATCMLYFKSLENGDAETSGVDELFTELTSHLSEEDLHYFAKWYELCIMEASHADKGSKDKYLWKNSAEHREKQGICFSGMKRETIERLDLGKKHLFKFRRKENHFNSGQSLKLVPLGCGERVIISEENKKVYNITTGYITDVSLDILTVSVDHEVRAISRNGDSAIYRIDRDDTLSNYTTPLSNLSRLFRPKSPTDDKLRKLIIKGEKPRFSEDRAQDIACLLQMAEDDVEASLSSTQGKALGDVLAELNGVQRSAIEKCLTAEDYVIIHGMPGSGKSTTIACLVRALVSVGKSVLLSSYTHSAVDTILTKLLKVGFKDFLRIGRSSRVHKKIIPYTYEEQVKSFTNVQEYQEFYGKQTVVATTCLGINHPLFISKRFDYCIVDEASQITQPVCIGPLRIADVFVLVGDHNQLPPLVLNPEAKTKGLDCSLLKSLSDLQNDAVVMLNYQYRMNKSIMLLMNALVYEDHMNCGNEMVANSLLKLPDFDKLYKEMNSNQLWDIVDPKNPVVFVSTDNAMLSEEKSASVIINRGEATLVKQIIGILIKCGLSHQDLGVISMYRQQVNLIREEVVDVGGFIEVDTMDKYQGKDKSCIIVSFVRSNSALKVGDLLKDWRRINVAITRAKTKLIMIGSRKTLASSDMLCKLVNLVDSNGWSVDLEK